MKKDGYHIDDFTSEELELTWNIIKTADGTDKGVRIAGIREAQAQVAAALKEGQ